MSLQSLYDDLRYQVIAPRVTTMGPCSTPDCGELARGSKICRDCLAAQIDAILDNRMASKWVFEQRAANWTACMLEDWIFEVGP